MGERLDSRPVLTLASSSPQRAAILDQIGVAYTAVASGVAERFEGEPREVVVENALRKARAVEGDLVLGADTAVVLGERVLGKPGDEAEARDFLAALSGVTHHVWSGVAVLSSDGERSAAACTAVRFRTLEAAEIGAYVATGEWRERAGGYAIQGRGGALVEAIDGDYLNVVGLPVATLLELVPRLLGPER